MLRTPLVAALTGALLACSPTFNWREMRVAPTALKVVLPCKPDTSSRQVPMGGREVDLQVLGCQAGGATFALLFADLGDGGRSGEVLAQWKQATLSNLRAARGQERPFLPAGAVALRQSVQVVASGQRTDGSKVESHAAYFARGSHVFQAVVYSDELKREWTDPFFSGLRFE